MKHETPVFFLRCDADQTAARQDRTNLTAAARAGRDARTQAAVSGAAERPSPARWWWRWGYHTLWARDPAENRRDACPLPESLVPVLGMSTPSRSSLPMGVHATPAPPKSCLGCRPAQFPISEASGTKLLQQRTQRYKHWLPGPVAVARIAGTLEETRRQSRGEVRDLPTVPLLAGSGKPFPPNSFKTSCPLPLSCKLL